MNANWKQNCHECKWKKNVCSVKVVCSRDRLLVENQTHDQKVASSHPSRSRRTIFFSGVNSVCWLVFVVCSNPMLPQWHIQDPSHSAISASGRLHLNTQIPLTQWSQSWLTMLLSRHSVGTYPEKRSYATCQGTIGHSRLRSLNHCEPILAEKVELVHSS